MHEFELERDADAPMSMAADPEVRPPRTYLRESAVNHDDHRLGCLHVGSMLLWN